MCTFCPVSSNQKAFSLISCMFWVLCDGFHHHLYVQHSDIKAGLRTALYKNDLLSPNPTPTPLSPFLFRNGDVRQEESIFFFFFWLVTCWIVFHLTMTFKTAQFSSVPWLIGSSGKHEGWFSRDFQSSEQWPLTSSGMGRYVHSLMLSIQHFLCWPQRHPPSKVPWRVILDRLSWCVTCPNHASFRGWPGIKNHVTN